MTILAIKILFLVIFYKLLCPKTLEKCLTAFNFTLFYTVKGPPGHKLWNLVTNTVSWSQIQYPGHRYSLLLTNTVSWSPVDTWSQLQSKGNTPNTPKSKLLSHRHIYPQASPSVVSPGHKFCCLVTA